MAASSWDGSIQVQNNTGGTIYYAVSAGTGAITVPTVSGTIGQGLQTITDLPSLDGRRIYFSNQKLTNSLFNEANPVNPSPIGPDYDKIYSFWEYSGDAGGFTWDVSDVQESSYPLQTVSASAFYSGSQSFGVSSYALLISNMISQPSFTGGAGGVGEVSDLIWSGAAGIGSGLPDDVRIIGPEFLWLTQQGGANAVSLLPVSMQNFLSEVPWNGAQLVTPAYQSQGWTTNWDVWQNATDISNGYTSAIAAASATGPQPQTGTPSDFRGVFTYPQEEDYGQVTYGPIPETIIINPVEEVAATYAFGTSENDVLRGTANNDVIVGGYGGDRMSGAPARGARGNAMQAADGGADSFLYVRADSSLRSRGLRDVITDFGAEDSINLVHADANALKAGVQEFKWIKTNAFSGRAGQLRIDYSPRAAFLQGDTDGNGRVDFEVRLLEVDLFTRQNLILA